MPGKTTIMEPLHLDEVKAGSINKVIKQKKILPGPGEYETQPIKVVSNPIKN